MCSDITEGVATLSIEKQDELLLGKNDRVSVCL